MRLIDADALKEKSYRDKFAIDVVTVEDIDNSPTVETKFELKTENGITYPNALDNMTFSHILSVEERQNIIQAYMLGANANARPQGEWITKAHSIEYYCSRCGERLDQCCENFCCHCGADMKGEKK